jgi:small-conductance mechanosensitive channel
MKNRPRIARLLLASLALWAAGAARAADAPPEQAVVIDGRELFRFTSPLGAFTPAQRARALEQRISRLARETGREELGFDAIQSAHGLDVMAGDAVLMTVTKEDAAAAGEKPAELAHRRARLIQAALKDKRRSFGWAAFARGCAFALAATAAFILALRLTAFLFSALLTRLRGWRGVYIRTIRLKTIEILPEERLMEFIEGTVSLARLLAVLIAVYAYVTAVCSFFPWTRGFSGKLFGYILEPLGAVLHGFVGFIPNAFFIGVIVFLTRYALKFTRLFFVEMDQGRITLPGFYPDWALPTYKIVRFFIIAFAAVMAFPYLPGAQSDAFRGVSIFLGVLFSLGSTSAVANVVAGVILTYMRAFKLGDRVKIADTTGDVIEKTLLVTRVRTTKNVHVAIPNAMVLGSHIINYSSLAAERGLILHTTVTIGYAVPWRQVQDLLIAAARAAEDIRAEPAPFVLQTSLNDFHVSYELNAYTDRPDLMAQTYSGLHRNIQERFAAAGVEIMSPSVHALRDAGAPALPPGGPPAAPGLRVRLEPAGGG